MDRTHPVHPRRNRRIRSTEIDGAVEDWTNVTVYDLPLTSSATSMPYPHGNGAVQMQCVYDEEKIYFLFHIPGTYRSGESEEDGETNALQKNAAISTIFKMGEEASLSNMVRNLGKPNYSFERHTRDVILFFSHPSRETNHRLHRATARLQTIAPRHSIRASPTKLIGS